MPDPSPTINKLLIITHVRHYRHSSQLYAYGPYVLEIEIWADLFPEILIAAPIIDAQPQGDCLPFNHFNIQVIPQLRTGGNTWQAKLYQILTLPRLVWDLISAMRQADAIHVRCPGNLGLLGVILGPLFSRYLIAKYASRWQGFDGEPWSYRLQRMLLRSHWWRGVVTVYGRQANESPHVVPFFTSIMTKAQMERAGRALQYKKLHNPLHVLYVGRLSREKNVHIILSALANLKAQSIQMNLTIVGVGELRTDLEAQVLELDLGECVNFVGGVSFDRVLDYYEQADVLVLASESEGWGKVLVEAMSFGLICIGSTTGLPEILEEGRGILVPPGDVDELANALRSIALSPEAFLSTRYQAAAWAEKYSFEGLREALQSLLSSAWCVCLAPNLPPVGEQSDCP